MVRRRRTLREHDRRHRCRREVPAARRGADHRDPQPRRSERLAAAIPQQARLRHPRAVDRGSACAKSC